ncbi:MAG TPA: helix-turn-helix transcriptional regulator [Pseudonocardiaceae bacterium]|nr:helix-turn-helix transcriptional regulator [Pseudonocardiaceae bacterium]
MQRAGLTGKQAAHLLGWSPSWVSRLLSVSARPPRWTSRRSWGCAG